jgi:hypothetical protein
MSDDTDWTYNEHTQSYHRYAGDCTADVWKDERGTWKMFVQSGTRSFCGYNYASMEDARAAGDMYFAHFNDAECHVEERESRVGDMQLGFDMA